MDAFDMEIQSETKYLEEKRKLLRLLPYFRDTLIENGIRIPDSVTVYGYSAGIALKYYSVENYRELSWLYRVLLKAKRSTFRNDDLRSSQTLETKGTFSVPGLGEAPVCVSIEVGLRDTCRVEYESKVVKVAKIVCNKPVEDIEGSSILSLVPDLESEAEDGDNN